MSSAKNPLNAASQDAGELLIYDDIGPSWAGMLGAKWLAGELKAMGTGVKTIDSRINSYGGEVFEGLTMYNLLKNHPATVQTHVDGVAASIASIIAMAGDTISMASGSFLMIHNPWGIAVGESSDMRQQADLLDKMTDDLAQVYADRSGRSLSYFKDLMSKETWIDAESALEMGLATEIVSNKKAVLNSISPRSYTLRNETPVKLRSCASLAAKLTSRIRDIDRDQMDDRTRGMVIADLYKAAADTEAEGMRVEDILSGKSGCQTDAALNVFADVLGLDVSDLRSVHAEDGCHCKTSAVLPKVDNKAQLAAWRAVGQRMGR